MNPFVNKRFWTSARLVDAAGGYGVALDGRRVKTPAKADLIVPNRPVAEMIVAEWDAQEGQVDPTKMPATRWANAAIDKVAARQSEVVDMLAQYGTSDLICYRADSPKVLADRQSDIWNPLLIWAKQRFEAPLITTNGLVPVAQPNQSLLNLKTQIERFDPFQLAAFHDLVTISGSLILSLAVSEMKISAAHAWDISRIDENWQIEQWGADDAEVAAANLNRQSFLFADQLLQYLR